MSIRKFLRKLGMFLLTIPVLLFIFWWWYRVSDVVRNGIPRIRSLAGFHPVPRGYHLH
jgi:hypothetical protein